MKKIAFLGLLALASWCQAAAGPDHRPAFDKSAYRGTLWTEVNPWWVFNKPRQHYPQGGPNYARKIYPEGDVAVWAEGMRECQRYGMTGWQFELNANAPGFGYTFKQVIQAAETLDNEFKLAVFLGMSAGETMEKSIETLLAQFRIFGEEWKTHPAIFRVDGRPVISVYRPHAFKPEEWPALQKAFEDEFGPALWLFNFYYKTYDIASKPGQVRAYMPYFDGLTAYANWTEKFQDELFAALAPIMHEEFPQKIFEGTVHNTYAAHYHYGGIATVLSEKYRRSWDSMDRAKPDAVTMTNLFDHWENSLVLPCYEREDFLLRYAQYRMHRLFGAPFTISKRPELVLTNYIDMIPGPRALRFEIIAFPLDGPDRQMRLAVEVCDTAGKPLHTFPLQYAPLDEMRELVFEVPADRFLDERAVVPRIVGRWKNEDFVGPFNPPTLLDPSLRASWMFWARSTANAVAAESPAVAWRVDDAEPGGTAHWERVKGNMVFRADVKPRTARETRRWRIMRNGMEWLSLPGEMMRFTRAFPMPHPGGALDCYWLEMEAPNGNRMQTLPVWVDAGERLGRVAMPVYFAGGRIGESYVEAARVPYYHYPCDRDTGELLLDVSGYQHHGRLQKQGKVSYAYGSLQATGYRHHHNGPTGPDDNPHFRRDDGGRGYLSFDGADKDFYMISAGTAFPYASTVELSFRVGPERREMYLLGTANNQINLRLDAEGVLRAMRGGAHEGDGGTAPKQRFTVEVASKGPVAPDVWHRVAVVYDLRRMALYLNGERQGEVEVAPTTDHETINHVTLGAGCRFLHEPHTYFTGDMRGIRLYGRNLSPDEFFGADD